MIALRVRTIRRISARRLTPRRRQTFVNAAAALTLPVSCLPQAGFWSVTVMARVVGAVGVTSDTCDKVELEAMAGISATGPSA